MLAEQAKTLEVLQIALQMEIDGEGYYRKASQQIRNKLGKELLAALALEEDFHRQKFEEIYHAISSKQAWPTVTLSQERGKRLRTIFSQASEELDTTVRVPATALKTIEKAMDMENKSYDFYRNQGGKARYEAEKNFYQSLAAEEKEHQLALFDYYEYLKDPAGFFVNKEHPSLDGG